VGKAVEDWSRTPDWPTMTRSRLSDGRLLGVDNSLWLYRTVPLAPVVEARTPEEGVSAAVPLMLALDEVAAMTSVRLARRASARVSYRQVHLLLVNLPQRFVPPADHPLATYLSAQFPDTSTDRRVLLFGVRLQASVGGGGGLRRAIDSVAETLTSGGTPLSDFDPDYTAMSAAMARSGLSTPTNEELRLASAWWNEGHSPDTQMLAQVECLHVFTTVAAARAAKRAGPDADLSNLGVGHHTITFAVVNDLDLPFLQPTDPRAHWATQLVEQGALAISVRGRVEPTMVTRAELRRQRKGYIDDINERVAAGKMERAEQSEQEALLADVEAVYAAGGPPTLIETSIVVGFNGFVPDVTDLSRDLTAKLSPMWYRQRAAMAETMLCSGARANPHLQDLPTQSVAVSGLPGLSSVGDDTGALIGFTELDRQPVYLDPMAATDQDSLPMFLVAAETGGGKSLTMLWLADQYARMGSYGSVRTPVIIIDPKALTLDTPIPTPDGWSTMGQVAVGDTVFGRDGRPCNVVHKSRVFTDTDLYEFHLDDGQVIRADNHHQWVVASQADRKKLGSDPSGPHWRELTTEQILEEGVTRYGQTNFSLPLPSPVEYEKADLAIPPYVLGAWLGDGTSKAGVIAAGYQDADEMQSMILTHWPQITTSDERSVRMIACGRNQSFCKRGHDDYGQRTRTETGEVYTYCRRCNPPEGKFDPIVNPSLHNLLVNEGLLRNKHIPTHYLRGSVEQRMELLRGLMDTDGTVKRSGACRFSATNRALADGVLELVRSLGIKAMLHTSVAGLTEDDPDVPGARRRRVTGVVHEVTFRTDLPVFGLKRKLELLPAKAPTRSRYAYIKRVVLVASQPAQCIRVDSPDHTYLVAGYVTTHNTGSDHSAAVLASGGQVASLDDLTSSDGIFDPIRFSAKPEVGVELAASMLMSINPWGTRRDDYETPLQYALHYGVSRGATCVGQALIIAKEAGNAPPEMVDAAFNLASSSSMFRACFGINPTTDGLRVAEGITLIKVGDAHLDLPDPGSAASATLPQRVAMALVRMMVFGSAMALTDRDGVIMLDEAWVFLSAGRGEMERLGRLARSQRVFPVLFTQRVSDAVKAGMSGYISRGMIGPIQDEGEARAACELFRLAPTPERMARITAAERVGSGRSTALNWSSMRALVEPGTREVRRGAVWIFSDISKRAVPVEVMIPPAFLARSSTNAAEIRRRAADAPAPTPVRVVPVPEWSQVPLPQLPPPVPFQGSAPVVAPILVPPTSNYVTPALERDGPRHAISTPWTP
jgi:hypothetical protein